MSERQTTSPDPETSSPADSTQLINFDPALPYRVACAAWPVPDVIRLNEPRFDNLDLAFVSHVVIILSLSRQEQILRNIGVRYNPEHPFPFWHFLGKIASKALWRDEDDRLEVLNFIAVRRNEYVAFETSRGRERGVDGGINALEVMFKRPRPGHPIQCFWKPARQLVKRQIQDWLEIPALGLGNRGKNAIVRPP